MSEHASKFAELLGEVVWDTKTNLEKRYQAEAGACEGKLAIATRAKQLGYDAVHDTVHEMAKDDARHGAGFYGLQKRDVGKSCRGWSIDVQPPGVSGGCIQWIWKKTTGNCIR